MRKLLTLFCLVIVLQAAISKDSGNTFSIMSNHEVADLNGASKKLSSVVDSSGTTMIVFWATWCKPCIEELDIIADYYSDWKATYKVKIIAISIDDSRSVSKVRPLIKAKRWPFDVCSDQNQKLLHASGFSNVPALLIINNQGKVLSRKIGFVPGDEFEIEDKLKEIR